ncbi:MULTISPECIES: hypothetical protein [unclassified Mesorhizobium]|uniref:hypothetical protein n=1 Tax=unclassified Mesorhizobium TaxID=325217 RepID=UPI003014B703
MELSKLTPEERLQRKRSEGRAWQRNNREKATAAQQRYRATEKGKRQRKAYSERNREKELADKKAYREKHREHIKARMRQYRKDCRERLSEYNRQYNRTHVEQNRQYYRDRRQKKQSINTVRYSPDVVYAHVSKVISRAFPRHMRDDLISSILLAVLEGKLLLDHVEKRAPEFVRSYNREYDTFAAVSLDDFIPGTEIRRIDTIAAPEPYELEEV